MILAAEISTSGGYGAQEAISCSQMEHLVEGEDHSHTHTPRMPDAHKSYFYASQLELNLSLTEHHLPSTLEPFRFINSINMSRRTWMLSSSHPQSSAAPVTSRL